MLARKAPPVQWLNEREVGVRLRELARDRSAWRHESDAGQFSLSGAQPKTALLREGRRWGIPSGRMPTTHILEPPSDQFPGHAENEHFCMMLARWLGLNTALSEVLEFDGAVAIVIERFDRVTHGKEILRLHAEDCCQALGAPPERKYATEYDARKTVTSVPRGGSHREMSFVNLHFNIPGEIGLSIFKLITQHFLNPDPLRKK